MYVCNDIMVHLEENELQVMEGCQNASFRIGSSQCDLLFQQKQVCVRKLSDKVGEAAQNNSKWTKDAKFWFIGIGR